MSIWGVLGLGLKIGAVLGPDLKTGGVVGHKNSTDGGTKNRTEDIRPGIFL